MSEKDHFYYSFGAEPEFIETKERGEKFDWRLNIYLVKHSSGPKECTFSMPERSELKNFPTVDISTYVKERTQLLRHCKGPVGCILIIHNNEGMKTFY